jgi:hypothetical protein
LSVPKDVFVPGLTAAGLAALVSPVLAAAGIMPSCVAAKVRAAPPIKRRRCRSTPSEIVSTWILLGSVAHGLISRT